jgi:hypothetical protein
MHILIYIQALISMNTHADHTSMSNSERLSRLDLEIHEVDHQNRLTINGDVASNWKNN